MASIANGLFWGGVTYMFASATTSLIVGLVLFILVWVAYLIGIAKTELYTWR